MKKWSNLKFILLSHHLMQAGCPSIILRRGRLSCVESRQTRFQFQDGLGRGIVQDKSLPLGAAPHRLQHLQGAEDTACFTTAKNL